MLHFCLITAAPTMAMAMQKAKHTLELKEQQISHLQEKVALLTEEKVFLRGRLEEGDKEILFN